MKLGRKVFGDPERVWTPKRGFLIKKSNSESWRNNMEVVNEAAAEARFDAAQVFVMMELTRQLDRIANALEHWIEP